MKKKPLTNKAGEVRELTREDICSMQPADEVLPADLLCIKKNKKKRIDYSDIPETDADFWKNSEQHKETGCLTTN